MYISRESPSCLPDRRAMLLWCLIKQRTIRSRRHFAYLANSFHFLLLFFFPFHPLLRAPPTYCMTCYVLCILFDGFKAIKIPKTTENWENPLTIYNRHTRTGPQSINTEFVTKYSEYSGAYNISLFRPVGAG